jgi:hypothetical protein
MKRYFLAAMKVNVPQPKILFVTTSSNCKEYRDYQTALNSNEFHAVNTQSSQHHSMRRRSVMGQCQLIDSLLYGLRGICAENVIDYPKLAHMHSSTAALSDNDNVSAGISASASDQRNTSTITYMIDRGVFDIIVYSDIHHRYPHPSTHPTHCLCTLS